MSQRRRRKAGRSRTSQAKKPAKKPAKKRVEKRVHRLTIAVTTTEKNEIEAKAKSLNVPRHIVTRLRVTGRPIPRPPAKRR